MEDRLIQLAAFSPAWRSKFESERDLLAQALGSAGVRIHHIGSTSITGISAKPVVDILVETSDLSAVDARNPAMTALGYVAKGENGIAERRFFQKNIDGERAFHVHAFLQGGHQVKRHLAFRDGMNANPDSAREYERVKLNAIEEAESKSAKYQALKGDYIESMTQRFVAEGKYADGAELVWVLDTPRLSLRRMVPGDLDFMASMLGHPEVMRYYPKPLDREEAKGWLVKVLGFNAKVGHAFWMVERKGTGERLGQVGLLAKEINGQAEVEVAYMIHRPYWKQGIATEAARACLEFGLNTMKLPRVVCMIRPENQPSLAVAERLKLQRIGETVHLGFPHNLYAKSQP